MNKKTINTMVILLFIVVGVVATMVAYNNLKTQIALADDDEKIETDKDDNEQEVDKDDEKDDDEKDDEEEKDKEVKKETKKEKDDDEDEDKYESKAYKNKEQKEEKEKYENKENKEEDEIDDEKDDEDSNDDEIISQEVLKNADGTTTKRLMKKDGEEIKIVEITYDSSGNKIMEKKMEKSNNEKEFKIKTYDVYGKKVAEYELKSKNGAIVKVEYKEGDAEGKVKFNIEKKEFSIKSENKEDGDVKIKMDGNDFEIVKSGIVAITDVPMKIDSSTGKIKVTTAKGDVVLKYMPDVIVKKIKEKGSMDLVNKVELQDDNQLKYRVQGVDFQKLLGIFTVDIPMSLTYDSQTGSLLSESTDGFFSKILNIFSF